MRMLYGLIVLLLIVNPVMADNKHVAKQLLKSTLDDAIVVLKNKSLGIEEKGKQISDIVSPMFDFNKMAQLALGKQHWMGLAKEDQKKYTDLFVNRLKASYLEKLNLYTDEDIVYNDAVEIQDKINILTELVTKDNRISMLYKLYKSEACWRIYDMEIQGISIIRTYRSQFDQVLSSGNINDLFKSLENPENGKPNDKGRSEL
jgi:phospholipid transport system substrate-binding protein